MYGAARGLLGLRSAVEATWTQNPPSFYSLALPAAQSALRTLDELAPLAEELSTHASALYTAAEPARAMDGVMSDIEERLASLAAFRSRLLALIADGPSPVRTASLYKLYSGALDIPTPFYGNITLRASGALIDVSTATPRIDGTAAPATPVIVDVLTLNNGTVTALEESVTTLGSTRSRARVSGSSIIATSDDVLYMRARKTSSTTASGHAGDFESASRLTTALEVKRATGGRVMREHISAGSVSITDGVIAGVAEGAVVSLRGIGSYVVAAGGLLSEYMTVTPAHALTGDYYATVSREHVRVRGNAEIVGVPRTAVAYASSERVSAGDEVSVGGVSSVVSRGGFGAKLAVEIPEGDAEVVSAMFTCVKRASEFDDFSYAWPTRVRTLGDARELADGVASLQEWISSTRDTIQEVLPSGQEAARRAEAAELIERHTRAGYDHAAALLSSADVRAYRLLREDEASFSEAISRVAREITILVQR